MLSKKIGIDLGTATATVYVRGEGVVIHEPSPLAAGGSPHGALDHLIRRAQGRSWLLRPEVMISVRPAVDRIARCELTEAAVAAGARPAWLIDKPLAAAIGAELLGDGMRHAMVCDLGAGSTEVAVLSRVGVVVGDSTHVGGAQLDRAIVAFMARRHGVVVDEKAAEAAKRGAGSAVRLEVPLATELGGRVVDSTELAEAMAWPLNAIAAVVRNVLEQTPAELRASIRARGLTLTGGGAELRGVDSFISERTGLPVNVAAQPDTCIARGAGLALDRLEVLKRRHA